MYYFSYAFNRNPIIIEMRTTADEYYSLYSLPVVKAQLTFRFVLQIYSGKIIEAFAENAFNPLLV